LAQAVLSEAGFATLWVIGSNVLEERPTNPLYTTDMGLALAGPTQIPNVNPDVQGQAQFVFDSGTGGATRDFRIGNRALYTLNGGCPALRSYDGLAVSGGGTSVYRYGEHATGTLADAALVMNSRPAEDWNTIFQSHPWFDIQHPPGAPPSPPTPAADLLGTVLSAVLPFTCPPGEAVDVPEPPVAEAVPGRTALHQNVPNPFNPVTTIRFDVAHAGRVRLHIYDVAGRRLRTLVDARMGAGAGKSVVWDGLDAAGRRLPSGLYFYRLEAPDLTATRKMLLVE
jgi:hypothetical protein